MRGVFGGYYPDYRTRALIPIYPFFVARHKPELAEAALSVVMDHWADVLWVSSNAPVLLNETAYNEINSGNVPRGKEILKKAVSLFPDDAYALSSLGVLCEKQNNFIDAERYNKLAIAADPHYSDAYYNLMVLYWKAADWKSATQALNDLQTASPNDPRVEKYMPFIRSKLNGARRSQ
jgi:Flp pilus assembly protein TadD